MKMITKVFGKRRNTWLVLLTVLLFAFIGCQNKHIDPQNPILGKWVQIQSDEKRVQSTEYREYLPDSIVRYFNTNEGDHFTESIYWLNDSLLYTGHFTENGFSGLAYKYEFFDKNRKLRLVHYPAESSYIFFAPIPTSVYQRIK